MRRLALLILPLAIANLGQAPALKGGTVTGTVTAALKGRKIANAELWVYLDPGKKPRNSLGSDISREIVQKDKRTFVPSVTVIPIGARISFPNRDKDSNAHNVFSPEVKASGWIGFDLGAYGYNRSADRKFLELGEFDIFCDIHKDMCAKVKVVPSRYFAKVVDGKFEIKDVVPGTYNVVAWAPNSRDVPTTQPVVVTAGSTQEAEALNVQYVERSCAHPHKDSRPYGPYDH